MAIPDYQKMLLPILKYVGDKKECSFIELTQYLSQFFKLTPEEINRLIPSGVKQTVLQNRGAWAKTYLVKAGLLEYPCRGYLRITNRGQELLAENPQEINRKMLMRFPEFVNFQSRKKEGNNEQDANTAVNHELSTPEESLEAAFQSLTNALSKDLVDKIKASEPEFFERLVVQLLVKMGYGGSINDAGQAVGRSGDGGIDGIIKEDKLGLDVIYIQAKKWDGSVGRPEIQKFVGALHGKHARKGVFITTGSFSREARDYVSGIDSKVILIDGEEMADLMIEHNLGVSTIGAYEIKKIDSDFFSIE